MSRIGKKHNVRVKFSHCPDYFPDDFQVRFVDNGEIATGDKEVGLGILYRMASEE